MIHIVLCCWRKQNSYEWILPGYSLFVTLVESYSYWYNFDRLCDKSTTKCYNITSNIFIILVKREINKRVTGAVRNIWYVQVGQSHGLNIKGNTYRRQTLCRWFSKPGIIFSLVKDSYIGSRRSFTYLDTQKERRWLLRKFLEAGKKEVIALLSSEPHHWAQSLVYRKHLVN